MKTWGFVVCSQNKELQKSIEKWINKFFPNSDIYFLEGEKSIFEAYNKGIELTKDNKYVCFTHEDIDIEKINTKFLETLLDISDTGFLGVAGRIKLNNSACWWEGYDGIVKSYLSGKAGHQRLENNKLSRWYNNYGMDSNRNINEIVEVLDGVILFCNRSLLNKVKWRSDIFNGWDFYDISITWEVSQLGYKNYTFADMELYHWGLGYPRNTWEENRRKFIEFKRNYGKSE